MRFEGKDGSMMYDQDSHFSAAFGKYPHLRLFGEYLLMRHFEL